VPHHTLKEVSVQFPDIGFKIFIIL
jgi:hypothetical protein